MIYTILKFDGLNMPVPARWRTDSGGMTRNDGDPLFEYCAGSSRNALPESGGSFPFWRLK